MKSEGKTKEQLMNELVELRQRVADLERTGAKRKQVEEALRESEERFRSLIENATIGLYRTTPGGRILLANPTLVRILGYSSFDELTQRSLEEEGFEPDYPRSQFRKRIEQEGEVRGLEAAWTRRDGSVVFVRESAKAIRGLDGTVLYYEGTVEDITERKQAEEKIRRRNEELAALNAIAVAATSTLHLHEVLQTIQERVTSLMGEKYSPLFSLFHEETQTFKVVLTGAHQQVRRRAERLMGTKFDQLSFPLSALKPELREALLAGKPYVTNDGSDILGPQVNRRLAQAAQRALGVNTIVDLPFGVKGKLVGTMTLLSQKERVPDEEMELLSAIASQAAIAIENARLFEVVARGKREWEATFDSVTEGIYLIDQNYTIIRANKAMAEGLGTRPQALIGRKCYEAVHQLKEPWSECPLQKALQTQQAITSELEDPNTSRTLQITVYPRFDEEGKALGSVHVVRDVTERKRREEEIERRNRELAALNAIAETVSGSLDLKEVLHRALDKVLEITGFEAGGIGLVDEAKELIVPMVHWGVPQGFLATFAQPRASDGLRWQSVKSGEAIFLEDLPHDSRVRGREALIEGFRAAAYLPLKVKEKAIGFMGLGTGHDHHFSPEEKSLLTTIASQIAVAIESARLYQESKEHAQRLERINERLLALQRISASVISTLDLREILKVIATNVATLLEEAYPPLFALFDRTSEAFRLVVATPQMKLIKKVERLTGIKFEGLTSSLAQMAPARREAVLARKPHLAQDASTLFGHLASEQVIRATQAALKINLIVQLPLWVKGNLVGIMLLFSRREEMSEEEMGMLMAIADQTAMAIENARAYQELKDLNLQTITALATAIEAKDPYTGGHSLGVTEKAVAIAQEMGLAEEEIEKLRVGGLLHDIGKIGIPDSVLNKPGRLTAAEYVMIKAHPTISAEIVGKIEGLSHLVPIIRHHHEWFNGNGYPDGLKEEEIPLLARVLAVADGFDAITSDRPYRPAKSPKEALAILKEGAGTQWDPKVVKALRAISKTQGYK